MTTEIKTIHPAREFLDRARLAKESIDRNGTTEKNLLQYCMGLYAAVESLVDAAEAREFAPCDSDQSPGVVRRSPGRPRKTIGEGEPAIARGVNRANSNPFAATTQGVTDTDVQALVDKLPTL